MKKDKMKSDYREGDQPELSSQNRQKETPLVQESVEKCVTAFAVIVRHNGSIDVLPKLPENIFPRDRDASLRDIRDACFGLAMDILVTMVVEGSSTSFIQELTRAAQAKVVNQMMSSKFGGLCK